MHAGFLILLAFFSFSNLFAQSWPQRPVRLVVPFTPGGNVDIVTRIVAQGLAEELKQNVVVENKPGANAAIGAEYVARAAPAGTPPEIVARLNRALNAATARADVRDRLLKAGVQPATSTAEETQKMVNAEWRRWGDVARRAGIKPE